MSVWAAAFGHPITWRGPSSHRYAGGLGGGSRGLVAHIASGFFEGTIAWATDPTASPATSSHWAIARDGRIAQLLDTADASWAQAAGNRAWHSVENEGFATDDPLHSSHPGWELLTDAQIAANAALFARGHLELGWPLQLAASPNDAGLGHHSMGGAAWGHPGCPGTPIIGQKLAILAQAIQLVTGDDVTQEELWTIVCAGQQGTGYAGYQAATAPPWAQAAANWSNQAIEARLTAQITAGAAEAKAARVAVEALAAAVNAGGGSIDTAAVTAHMDVLAAADTARDAAHHAEVEQLRAALAQALTAAAGALHSP